jgi:hypothetical protein
MKGGWPVWERDHLGLAGLSHETSTHLSLTALKLCPIRTRPLSLSYVRSGEARKVSSQSAQACSIVRRCVAYCARLYTPLTPLIL